MTKLPDELAVSGSFMNKCYIVTIQGELKHESLNKLHTHIVQTVYDTDVRGTILDFSSVTVFDTEIFDVFKKITQMIAIMGVAVVWIGLKPCVASALVDFNVDISSITVAMNLEHGLEMIKSNTFVAEHKKI